MDGLLGSGKCGPYLENYPVRARGDEVVAEIIPRAVEGRAGLSALHGSCAGETEMGRKRKTAHFLRAALAVRSPSR
jgi:hypothetical protein